MRRVIMRGISVLVCWLAVIPVGHAAAPDIIAVDLPTLIDQVADQPERFAVDIPRHISTDTQGHWTSSGAIRTWSYSVRVPTAVSLSFHAQRFALPASAVLVVSGASAAVSYRGRDASRGALWSRPLVGDTLSFSLTVAAAEADAVKLELQSVQAGYRGLGGLRSHPHYLARTAGAASQNCSVNYSCDATAANQGPANATVAVVIANTYQCTGTLLNDSASDFTPYVLTARHCENGKLGGGDPLAAANVSIYWDAVSSCGAALGSIYDGTAQVQNGATTVVEQQDAWLLRLDAAPVAADAYFAGWDATGSAFTGGYSVHHALGFDRQYTGWYGKALLQQVPGATLSVGYASTFWGLVNQTGNVGAGASGGAVFDPNNHVVGSASLAALQNGENSAGVCPLSPPSAPAAATVSAQYTALSAVFASTADATSSTGTVTLQSALDPDNSGVEVLAGVGHLAVSLSGNQDQLLSTQTLTLTWDAPGAQSCTASGGVAGDGWAGARPASGSLGVNNYTNAAVTYTLSCTGSGTRGTASVNVLWTFIGPVVTLNGPPLPATIGSTVQLQWGASTGPCVASGGIAGDGWAGSKTSTSSQQNVVVSQLGTISYSLTCGTAPEVATAQASVTVVPVAVALSADSTRVRVGTYVTLIWVGAGSGNSCTTSGGGAGDGWAQTGALDSGGANLTETTAGTYNYTVQCTGGGQTVTSSVAITFTNDPPTVTLTAIAPTQQTYTNATAANATPALQWYSNVTGCFLASLGPLTNRQVALQGQYPGGTASPGETVAGQYTYTLTCDLISASASITWINTNPTLTITAPTTTWAANEPYPVFWTTDTEPCTQTGGAPGDGWAGTYSPGQASETVTEAAPGNYTLTLTCGTAPSVGSVSLQVTVPPAAVSISASPTSVPLDSVVQLTWNSTVGPCSAVGTAGDVNWGGSDVAYSGSTPVIETTAGTFTYAISCGSGSQAVQASTTVTVEAPPPTSISASTLSAPINTPVTLTWDSSDPVCNASGGDGSDGWSGPRSSSGSQVVSDPVAGTVTYAINCNGDAAQTQVAYMALGSTDPGATVPSATLTSSPSTQLVGATVTLSWSSQNAVACTASGGSGTDGWSGSLALMGVMQITEQSAGQYTYTLTCSGAPPAATVQTTVTFTSTSGGTSGGKSGGGGALGPLSLLLLALPVAARLRRPRRGKGRPAVRALQGGRA